MLWFGAPVLCCAYPVEVQLLLPCLKTRLQLRLNLRLLRKFFLSMDTAKLKSLQVIQKLQQKGVSVGELRLLTKVFPSISESALEGREKEALKAVPEEMPPMVATQSATPAPVAASASTTAPSEISMAVEPVRVALAAADRKSVV